MEVLQFEPSQVLHFESQEESFHKQRSNSKTNSFYKFRNVVSPKSSSINLEETCPYITEQVMKFLKLHSPEVKIKKMRTSESVQLFGILSKLLLLSQRWS